MTWRAVEWRPQREALEIEREPETAQQPPSSLAPWSVLALQQHAGNAAVSRMLEARRAELPQPERLSTTGGARSLQRFEVNPMPRVRHQWLRKRRLVDLNCGWYAQMGVVDYHYLNSIRPQLTQQQRAALESKGHLGYHAAKSKLHHHSTWGFNPKRGTSPAAVATDLAKPDTPDQWKSTLRRFGPLIVAKAGHYVLVVGVTSRSFYYLDSLTGLPAYHDFLIMNRIIDEVYCVKLSDVQALFQAELQAAQAEEEETEESADTDASSASDETSETAASDETSDPAESDETSGEE